MCRNLRAAENITCLFVSVKMEAVEVAGFKCDAVCEQRGGETVAEQDDS